MLASITHILPLTTIRRERVLPIPGKIVVRKGQKVSASDSVAEANLAPEHLLLDLARGLGLPAEEADEHIQCKVGDQLAEGDIVAGPVGIARRVVRTPKRARVVLIGGGQAMLEVQSQPFELKAGLSGDVIDLVSDRGVIVQTQGALVQGVWGNGKIDFGLMFVLVNSPEDILASDQLDVSMRGSIVLGGHCADPEVLKTAMDMPLRGLVLGSMNPSLLSVASRMPYPVLVLEGFGQIPMNSAAYKLLTTNERREVSVNAEPWDPYSGSRPEVVISLPTTGVITQPVEAGYFVPEQQVRVISAPYRGKIGTIANLDPGLYLFPNGIRALAAQVILETGEDAVIPLANLEVLA
jgi:hypothetical protein